MLGCLMLRQKIGLPNERWLVCFDASSNQVAWPDVTKEICVHSTVPFLPCRTHDPQPAFFKGYVCLKLIKAICIE